MKKLVCILSAIIIITSAKAQNCPTITVIAPSEVTAGDTLTFSADVKNGSGSFSYNWSISAGTIISGQGTSTIMVNTDGLDGQSATATVELGGLPANCTSYSSSTVYIMAGPEKILSANYTTPQALTADVQKLITQTKLNDLGISQTAFIYIYKGSSTTTTQFNAMKSTIVSVLTKNKIFYYQYKIADGGKKKIASYEMYNLLPGVAEPKPSR